MPSFLEESVWIFCFDDYHYAVLPGFNIFTTDVQIIISPVAVKIT